MLVSVIVITHNFEKYIEECLNSISNQSYKKIEIIVVDDKSTDDTFKIIKKYQRRHPQIKIFQNKENVGKAKSVNFALEKIKGDLIVIFDGDDIMPSQRIEEQVKFMEKNPQIDMSYGNMIILHENGEREFYDALEIKGNLIKRMKKSMKNESLKTVSTYKILDDKKFIPGTSVMIRKRVFDSGIRIDPKVWAATDYDLWLQIIGRGFKLKKAPIVGLIYRRHPGQLSRDRNKNKERTYIFNKLKSGKYFDTSSDVQ